ncbi:MAG TPA: MoaD/ThiS family protein [Elusimicrobiales bacterium]|nr:MoaD/ThiS family protein [Elusimicrobiales bacterium]
MRKKVQVRYFALVGERRGVQTDAYETEASTARQLLREIEAAKSLPLTTNISKAVINGRFAEWDDPIKDGDLITLLSPFSGG